MNENATDKLPAFDQNRTAVSAFVEYCGIMFGYKSKRQAYAEYGPENVKKFEERFARAYREVNPGLKVPTIFGKK